MQSFMLEYVVAYRVVTQISIYGRRTTLSPLQFILKIHTSEHYGL